MSFEWLTQYLPRGIYARAALIMVLPVVVVQAVVSFVFVKEHYEDVTRQMTITAAREVRLVLSLISDADQSTDLAARAAPVTGPLAMTVRRADPGVSDETDKKVWYDFTGITITERMRLQVPEVTAIDLSNDRVVRLILDTDTGWVE